MKKHAIALLYQVLPTEASADVQLLPAGEFAGRDGRPGNGLTWKLPDAQGKALAARLTARHAKVQFNFDYEHQALLSEKNGQPAPASGWGSAFEWRPGQGLFALSVDWTAKASQMIDAKEYKYLSPAIVYDKASGVILDVINASLTNIPALDIDPVAQERLEQLSLSLSDVSFSHQPPEQSTMNEVLKALLKALGLPETDATTAEQAVSAVAALKADAAKLPELTTEVAALKASGPDPTKWVSLDKFNELNAEVARLSAVNVDREVDELLKQAVAQGKCSAVVESVWREVGKANVAQLKALIEKTPANPALAGLSQTAGKKLGDAAASGAAATSDELAMCKNLGLTLEQFRAGAD